VNSKKVNSCYREKKSFSLEVQLKGLSGDTMHLSEFFALGQYYPFAPQLCKGLHTSISSNGGLSSVAFLPQLLDEMSFE